MEEIVTPLVPLIPRYYDLPGPRKLDYPAICCFAAIGFFLDEDTFFTNRKAFRPATKYQFDEKGNKISQKKYFEWHYTPRDITFEETLKEFSRLMEMIVQRDCAGKRIILPISGGLDSRVLAAVVKENKDTFAYSYEFQDGVPENVFGRAVARAAGFEHEGFIIPSG